MVGTHAGRRVGRLERLRRASVRPDLPAPRHLVIDRPPHDRVPEAEPARRFGRADEIEPQELVDRGEDRFRALLGDRGHELGLERLAGHGCRLERPPRLGGRREDVGADGLEHGLGHGLGRMRPVSSRAARPEMAGSRELLDVERVAAALAVQHHEGAFVDARSDQRPRLFERE